MKEEQIEQMLLRYMEGETTSDEEMLLQRYFASGKHAPRFEAYAALFATSRNELPALTEVEGDEILSLCPAPRQHGWWMGHAMRYAAVWMFGIFSGSIAMWVARPGLFTVHTLPGTALTEATAKTDTLYRERVVMQRDTVYVVKHFTMKQDNASVETAQSTEEKTENDAVPAHDNSWNYSNDLAILTE